MITLSMTKGALRDVILNTPYARGLDQSTRLAILAGIQCLTEQEAVQEFDRLKKLLVSDSLDSASTVSRLAQLCRKLIGTGN